MADAHGAVQGLLDTLVAAGVERGVQVAAYRDGQLVVDAWAGVADPLTGQPVDGDTLFTVFSCGKGIIATVIHLLAERGDLRYDEPIATYWPEFGTHGKERITIRHALTHTAGIPQQPIGVNVTDWQGMCRAIADLTPLWEPGTQTGYHATTFGFILGEVARRTDGRAFDQIVTDDICRPLGTTSLYFGLPDEMAPRVAVLENDASITNAPDPPAEALIARALPGMKGFAAQYNAQETRRAVIPARGGLMNARSLARHYAALIGEGVDGVRLLPPERVRLATALQTDAQDLVTGSSIRKGLGYYLGSPGSPMSARVSAFGHPGFGGLTAFADPDYGLAMAVMKNRIAFSAPGEDMAERVAKMVRHALDIPEA